MLVKYNNYFGDKYNILSIFQGKFKEQQSLALEGKYMRVFLEIF